MQVTPSLSALHNTRTDGEMNVVFTRLKIALPQEEEFEIRRFPFSYWGHSQGINNGCWRLESSSTSFIVDFSGTDIGSIRLTPKSESLILEHQQGIPDPENFVDAHNTRGTVEYEWVTQSDTSQLEVSKALKLELVIKP
ncbi:MULTISPECIES: hypothetical protein [Enterococcus]|uniref:hypothetical protein n=1 Tax=Enterococcus TaxID=1350 RepID=UPI00032DBA74|nr:hypothetical protein [Enterococcus mundtii]EOH61750.1 hypothetical protein UAC_01549 [Enterococcus mundtii ATCC 882]EOU12740.1 hypothetical protein I587_01287 [Enterococcus mundtii ATCC 882]PJK25703.1 hypothetical protein CV769_09220 [Enterococcus mundtii]UBM06568.1 hypothetical protein K9N66_05280 [Enterococcus mundtii]